MKERGFVRKNDLIILAVALVLGVLLIIFMGGGKRGAYAEILRDNTVIKRVDLSKDNTFSLEEYPQVFFKVENGAVAFVKSDCPDKICVHTGFIKNKGQSAVCLPNRLTLRIAGESAHEDAIAG